MKFKSVLGVFIFGSWTLGAFGATQLPTSAMAQPASDSKIEMALDRGGDDHGRGGDDHRRDGGRRGGDDGPGHRLVADRDRGGDDHGRGGDDHRRDGGRRGGDDGPGHRLV